MQVSKQKAKAVEQEAKPVQKAADQPKPTPAGTHKEKLLYGIPGLDLTEIERNVPDDDAPRLESNSRLKWIGKHVPRYDGMSKASGAARYSADVRLPGMLYASFVDAGETHARISSIDTAAAEKHPGVRAVYIIENPRGSAELIDKSKEPASRYPVVRYAGQPIAAIAATSQHAAEEAVALVKVEYDPLPFVLNVADARRPDAAKVFPGAAVQGGSAGGGGGAVNVPQHGNVRGPNRSGNVKTPEEIASALSQCDAVVEGDFDTQVQTHSALETHGVVADWHPEGLTVYASTQSTMSVRDELAEVFDLPKSKVRVLTDYMGGGFGAKFGAGNVGVVAAQLSKKAGAPVRLFATRKEEHWANGNRPDSHQSLKLGAKTDGKLHAMHLVSYGTAGVSTGAGTAGPVRAMYECPNVLAEEYDVFINAGPGTAFRAPGHPQGCFALEQLMDELAEKLNMDPVELRNLNDKSDARLQERKLGAERFGWSRRRKPNSDPGPVKRGMGMAQAVWYRIVNRDSGCEVRISRDGSVEALSAVQDIGGGIKTVIAQVVAEELGISPKQVTVRIGDTNFLPGPPSGGSMTTTSITPAVRNAAYKAKQKLFEAIAPSFRAKPSEMVLTEGKLNINNGAKIFPFKQAVTKLPVEQISASAMRSPEYGSRDRLFLGGVQFVELAVDTETGIIKVERVTAVHDCGRPMNLLSLESQVNGGILQGISYALYENRKLDRNTGIMVNPNLEQYKIVGSRETPKIEVVFIEDYLARSSTDAGGIGEPATIPTAAAIANAFYNATGARMRSLPMTPARVLEALGKLKSPAQTRAGGAL